MDTLVYKIYADENAELNGLQTGEIDLTDYPLTPSLITTLTPDPNFYVTAPFSETGYFELEFHLANTFWNCNMNLGNSVCGREIRQAFAHALDKNVFTSTQAGIAGVSVPIDNPVPPSVDLTLPNPCAWDSTHVQSGVNCVVGINGMTGGVAYHLNTASQDGGSGVPFAWTPQIGSPDFCAAADHLVAAGIATAKNSDCTLTGHLVSAVSSNPISIFIANDNNARLQGGQSVSEFICALLTGSYTVGCPGLNYTLGPIINFPGYQTSPTTTINLGWQVFTAFVNNIPTFDRSLFAIYNSRFVSGIPSIQPPSGTCSSAAVPSFDAPNYMYLCDPTFDGQSDQAEFAPCLSASGDPVNGQVAPTFANCPSTTRLSSTSASYQAQDEFGKNAFTIPWFSLKSQFAYRSNWQRVVLNGGNGFTPPGNIQADFNAYSPSPSGIGTIRQGYKQAPISVNPFASSTPWELGIQGAVWDTPGVSNPSSPSSPLDWMTISTQILQNNQLTYTPAPGSVETYRFTFRPDINWQTGQPVTAWDAAFSYIAFKSTGVAEGAGLAPMVGVKVLSRTQLDVNINSFGPFTQLSLSTIFILPARLWLPASQQAAWDSAISNPNFAGANAALTPLIGSAVTASGVVLPTTGTSAVDTNKINPGYDPIATGTFVGSGPWACRSSTGAIGQGCTSSGTHTMAPGSAMTLQRFGLGTTPGGSMNAYFRSSGNLALCAWANTCTVDFNRGFLYFSTIDLCFGAPLQPLGSTNGCAHWQQGIGAPGGYSMVGVTQVGIAQRFMGVNAVMPYNWVSSPPPGVSPYPPLLYEGLSTGNFGNPFALGTSQTLTPASLAGCSSIYPIGGYDC
jgi:ABC-type transport system substrate-binding protein